MNASNIDTDFYRSLYEDLGSLSDKQLRRHWLDQGQREGRFASELDLFKYARTQGFKPEGFSAREYLLLNPDLPVDLLAGQLALHHFVTRGITENRAHSLRDIRDDERRSGVDEYVKQLTETVSTQSTQDDLAALHFAVKRRIPCDSDIARLASQIDAGDSSLSELLQTWVREELTFAKHFIEGQFSHEHRGMPAGDAVNISLTSPHFGDQFARLLRLPSWYSPEEWMERFQEVCARVPHIQKEISRCEPEISSSRKVADTPEVTVLCSVYKGDDFISDFLRNIRDQSFLADCELFFMLVHPSNLVREAITQFANSFPSTKVIEVQEKVSIYAAWNYAIHHSTGRYITNANVDDARRPDSIRIQFDYLESHPEVDIVFQDYYLTLIPHIPWNVIEEIDCRTNLPEIAEGKFPDGLIVTHSAPMWRRSLHNQVGYFNPSLESAGDYDFWIRCIVAQRMFAKLPEVHAAYFANPNGLSTRAGGQSARENEVLHSRYWWLFQNQVQVSACD